MDWMLLIVSEKDAPPAAEPVGMAEMGQFAGELGRQGKMRGGAPLHPEAAGARVSVRGGRATVTDGPFAEAKEVVGGYFLFDAASRAEALEIGERCPHVRAGIVELRPVPDRDAGTPTVQTPFMLLLHESPGHSDADGAMYREMVAFDDALRKEGSYVECSQLPCDARAARITQRGGKLSVTDGPFAEAKEVVGGYFIVSAADRAGAIEMAKRCPHARWGAIEVREVMKIGPM